MKRKKDDVHGEGNYKAAREFDQAEAAFVRSGRLDQAARNAAPKSPAEVAALTEAEQAARRRARDEDPALHRIAEAEQAARRRAKNPALHHDAARTRR
ncbi:MAG TPA: hypothetical protein VJQ49_07740 [Casimicrobiaceae bacterium]|nr:hypothetical protein [Casimicrobiaceae bacterium]